MTKLLTQKPFYISLPLLFLVGCSTPTKNDNESNIDFVMRVCEKDIDDKKLYNTCVKSAVDYLKSQPSKISKEEMTLLLRLIEGFVNTP